MEKVGREGSDQEKRGEVWGSGIMVSGARTVPESRPDHPRISAFVWGGKVRPSPTLPFGRWKGAA
jgi:hypothetical protein